MHQHKQALVLSFEKLGGAFRRSNETTHRTAPDRTGRFRLGVRLTAPEHTRCFVGPHSEAQITKIRNRRLTAEEGFLWQQTLFPPEVNKKTRMLAASVYFPQNYV